MDISVGILTYNQENTIGITLDSVLQQETTYSYHIVVCDDASPDGTATVVEGYMAKYPGKITLIRNEKNLGLIRNFKKLCDQLDGRFVTICAGDDYWHDKQKLQKQADFLDQHKDYGLVHSDYDYVDMENRVLLPQVNKHFGVKYDSDDARKLLIAGNYFILPSTIMMEGNIFREERGILQKCVENNLVIEDLCLYVKISARKKFRYLTEATTSYRIVRNSLSRPGSFEKKIEFYQGILNVFHFLKSEHLIDEEVVTVQQTRYYKNCLKWSAIFGRKKEGRINYRALKQRKQAGKKDFFFYLSSQFSGVNILYKWLLRKRLKDVYDLLYA